MAKNKARYNSASHKAILLRCRTFSRPADRRILTSPPARHERKRKETDRLVGTTTFRASACTERLRPRSTCTARPIPNRPFATTASMATSAEMIKPRLHRPPNQELYHRQQQQHRRRRRHPGRHLKQPNPPPKAKRRRKKRRLPSDTALTRHKIEPQSHSKTPNAPAKASQQPSEAAAVVFSRSRATHFRSAKTKTKPASRPVGRPVGQRGWVCVCPVLGESSRTILASPRFYSIIHATPFRAPRNG